MMTKQSSVLFHKPELNIAPDEILVFSNVRNEAMRLPFFFSFYRNLGVSRFFIVDNASTDDTASVIKSQPDAHYFYTNASYATSVVGCKWTSELANHYGTGHWCLTVDADELFVFPGIEFLSYRDLIEYLEEQKYDGVFGVFLDMYHPGMLTEAQYVPGTPFLATCPAFDVDSYWLDVAPNFPNVDICGGARWRMFWAPENRGVGPTMRKHVLIKWRPGFEYRYSTHSMTPVRLADVTTAVLHFKFFFNFSAFAGDEYSRGDRFRMDHYTIYKEAVDTEKGMDFAYSGTRHYKNSATLVRSGFVCLPESFLKFLLRKSRSDASQLRYRAAIKCGLALDLPRAIWDFVDELSSIAREGLVENQISLKQFCRLWPILEATTEKVSQGCAVAGSAGSGRVPGRRRRPIFHGHGHTSGIDLTVAVTVHSETLVAGPAMLSASAAIHAAEAEGLRVERLIGLDAPTADCRAFFTQPAFATWKIVELEKRDLGLTRNALVEIATGRWIAFLDADDLFSENWLVLSAQRLAQAEEAGDRVIVHPEINWIFDRHAAIVAKTAQDDRIFTPYYFYFANYYDSLCMAPRAAHLKTPYAPRDIPNGLSYQDWQWNIETMAAGWRHVVARDTIVFKRRRDVSLVTETTQRRAIIRDIEPMAIDRVAGLGKLTEGRTGGETKG